MKTGQEEGDVDIGDLTEEERREFEEAVATGQARLC